ncbi:hypothetical protein F5J12DRAFT_813037 [Pisolithus orientalis]|uniref:uncharacterized protein n=1 Tax=Pisolithus orientalis TaxID=936130 RepID=UPI0022246415|nr:uncharacterized protein F5J12DRAFT_813037 [Pisolithus orientalis]KAI6019767.1 hypothetical protein F5J12DRAFT_813037 [Pisolithus orientalis]
MSSGTQSPPLEATGSHNPMGVSCIDGSCSKPMKDVQQREGKSGVSSSIGLRRINVNASMTNRIFQ